jgi:hypothetical protein
VADTNTQATLERLSDLREAQAADATLRNLVHTLSAKLEFCARFPVLAYEAEQEGHVQTAAAFSDLATGERRLLDELLETTKRFLEGTEAKPPEEKAS